MTIFQKLLLLPLLSLVLYTGFILYSHSENQRNSRNIQKIRDDYMPLLEVTNENIGLFNEISSVFKDAVVSREYDWVDSNLALKQQVDANLSTIGGYPHIVDRRRLDNLSKNFQSYYDNARTLSLALLGDGNSLGDSDLVERVERYHNLTSSGFTALKSDIQAEFRETVTQTHRGQNQLVLMSSGMAAMLLVTLAAVGLATSLSIRRKLLSVNSGMRSLATGEADFSRRLEQNSSDELGTLVYWFNQLSDKLEADYKNIELISITDKLTGLNNRLRTDVYLDECIARAKENKTHLAVVLIDLDRFKEINDNYGHLAGDRVLISVAEILKSSVDPGDFLGRWGGEEFILVLPGKSLQRAVAQSESIRSRIEQSRMPEVGRVTASFGVGVMAANDDQDSLIKGIDAALYRAKDGGRNRVVTR